MKILNLKSYFVFLGRNKMYTAINVVGLAASLALVVMIGLYVQHEKTLDRWQSNADNIYVLGGKFHNGTVFEGSHWYMQKKLRSRYPEIESTCAVAVSKKKVLQNESGTKTRVDLMFADSTFFNIFDYTLAEGDRGKALDDKQSIVINRQTARALFGNASPIGKTVIVVVHDTIRLRVTGIMDEMRETTLTPATAVIRYEQLAHQWDGYIGEGMNNAMSCSVFMKTKPGTDFKAKEDDMLGYFKTFFWLYERSDMAKDVTIYPLLDLHFADIDAWGSDALEFGDSRLVNIMVGAGLAVLLFSLMNYINLTVAQGGFRAREMAMRRLLGCRRKHIVMRLIAESLALCAISLALALGLVAALLPAAGELLDVDIRFIDLLTPVNICTLFAALVAFGVAAGIAPAVIISSAKPIDVVRGTFRQRTKMLFSKIFIVIQNLITIVMLASALTMMLQVRHLVNAPLGYDTDRLMQIHNEAEDTLQQTRFIQELRKLPCVEIASVGYGLPLIRGNNQTMDFNGKSISFQELVEDTAFMRLTGLELLKDNHTSQDGGERVFVNRQALREQGLDMNATHFKYYEGNVQIDGILKDFQIGTITSESHPVIVKIFRNPRDVWNYTIKYRGDATEAYNQVNDLHRQVFDVDINNAWSVFVDQQIQQCYESNIRTMRLVSIFTVIAIIISLMGLVAMSTYFIEQRKREIAVRRVFGGSTKSILSRLVGTFMAYVAIAFVVAVPIIYYLMSDWLADFSYRISLSPLIFIAAGVASLVISFVAVFFQSRKAANANPAETIKDNG